jgi:hypothetical protein
MGLEMLDYCSEKFARGLESKDFGPIQSASSPTAGPKVPVPELHPSSNTGSRTHCSEISSKSQTDCC